MTPLEPPETPGKAAPPPSRAAFHTAFLSSALGTGLSRVFGALRDIVIAFVLGAGVASDAFFVAFTIPNAFRRFVADEGLTGALIPAVAQAEAEADPAEARRLVNTVFTMLLVANGVLCIVGILAADWLVAAFAYAFLDSPEKYELTVQMTRWLMPILAMVSGVSFMEALLNHRGHYFTPKLAPGLIAAGIAGGALVGAAMLDQPAWGLVGGALVGGALHVAINIPVLLKRWGGLAVSFAFSSPRARGVARELSKVVAIGMFAQVNLLVLRQLAAFCGDGAVTRYWYANRVIDLAQGIIAVAIGSALLPGISKAAANHDMSRLREELATALRLAAFLLIPVAAVLLSFANPLAALLFRVGEYTWEDAYITGIAVIVLVPFMLAVAAINLLKKVFFAFNDRNPLLWVGAVGVLLTGALGLWWASRWDIVGLAGALSASAVIQLLAYVLLLQRRTPGGLGLGALGSPFLKMTLAALPSAAILALAAPLGQWPQGPLSLLNWAVAVPALGLAAAAYLGASHLLGIEEQRQVMGRITSRLRRGRSSG